MAANIRLYLDESLSPAIAKQLVRRGITAVSAREIDTLGDSDVNHLRRATEDGYVLCTADTDFLKLAASGMEHAGIIFGAQEKHNIGDWVKSIEIIHGVYSADDMKNHVEYL